MAHCKPSASNPIPTLVRGEMDERQNEFPAANGNFKEPSAMGALKLTLTSTSGIFQGATSSQNRHS